MNRNNGNTDDRQAEIEKQGVPEPVMAFVHQSPISMWVTDSNGTLVTENEASRQLFRLSGDDTLVGNYNIFKDDEIINQGYAPRIRRVFEEGISTHFVIDYQFSYVRRILHVNPTHLALRVFIFVAKDISGGVGYAIVQHEDYTEQWRIDKSLAESEAHYRNIVEHISDWVWVIDTDGRLLYSNPVAETLIGRRTDYILGRCIVDFVAEQTRDKVRQALNEAIRAKKRINHMTMQIVSTDGSTSYLEARGEPIFDQRDNLIGYRGIAIDMTERHLAEEAIRRSEERFHTIFDHVPAAIFVYDRDGVILQANAACEQVYGILQEHLVGRSMIGAVARSEEIERVKEILGRVFSGETVKGEEWEIERPDGSAALVSANTAPLYDESGNVVSGIGLNIDITERTLQEQRRLELEKNKRDFYRSTILAATGGKLVVTDHEEIEKMAGPSLASWSITEPEEVRTVRHGVADVARSAGMDEPKIEDLVLCVGELMTNTIKHAGGGDASIHQLPDALLFVCRDHGPGIETMVLPQVTLEKGYSTAHSLGMGYKEVIQIGDKVSLATDPRGTTVAVEMKLKHEQVSSEAQALLDRW
ncbi:MAG: PAS domain S-box protein [Armatimonadota bacterium]